MSDSIDTICVHGVRNPTEQCNCCMNDLIAELRTKVRELEADLKALEHELEGEIAKERQRTEAAEAKVARVEALPKHWLEEAKGIAMISEDSATAIECCADELQAALQEPEQ